MPTVIRVIETALYVADIRRAADFYRRLFHFDMLLETDRLIALDVAGRSVLLLFPAGRTANSVTTPGGTIPGHGDAHGSPGHLAFAIEADEFGAWKSELASAGIPLESEVTWPGGATSLYFRDPDQNLVELLTPGFWRIY